MTMDEGSRIQLCGASLQEFAFRPINSKMGECPYQKGWELLQNLMKKQKLTDGPSLWTTDLHVLEKFLLSGPPEFSVRMDNLTMDLGWRLLERVHEKLTNY